MKDKKSTSIVNAFKKIISEGRIISEIQIKYGLIRAVNSIINLLQIF